MDRETMRLGEDFLCCLRMDVGDSDFVIPFDSDYVIHDAFFAAFDSEGVPEDIASKFTMRDTIMGGKCSEYGEILDNNFRSTVIEYGDFGRGYVFRISEGVAESMLRSNSHKRPYDLNCMKNLTGKIFDYVKNSRV